MELRFECLPLRGSSLPEGPAMRIELDRSGSEVVKAEGDLIAWLPVVQRRPNGGSLEHPRRRLRIHRV